MRGRDHYSHSSGPTITGGLLNGRVSLEQEKLCSPLGMKVLSLRAKREAGEDAAAHKEAAQGQQAFISSANVLY